MTSSPFDGCDRREPPALMRATPPTRRHDQRSPAPETLSPLPTRCAERRRRQGPPAAPRSGYARALTPPPDFGAPGTYGERQKKDQPYPLTGPVPSGMTCGDGVGIAEYGEERFVKAAQPLAGLDVRPARGVVRGDRDEN